jgi:hypothetical protein
MILLLVDLLLVGRIKVVIIWPRKAGDNRRVGLTS